MASTSNKKLILLYVLEILKKDSDENHPLRQEDIAEKIYKRYGMECDRKTIASNLGYLIDFGYDIQKIHGKGFFLGEREFEPSEIMFLVDAIFSSKIISSKQAKSLCTKLYSFLSKNDSQKFRYVYKSDEVSRTDQKQLFYTLGMISDAIEMKKKIEFSYNRAMLSGKNEKKYIVSPYFFTNNQGKYYLVSFDEKHNGITNYKLEKIENIKILDDDATPIKKIKGYENGIDKVKYSNQNFYAFGGETISATLKLSSENYVDYVYDWFDKDTCCYIKNGEIFADVKVNEQSLIYWCLQYGSGVELILPVETREKIAKMLKEMCKKYEK